MSLRARLVGYAVLQALVAFGCVVLLTLPLPDPPNRYAIATALLEQAGEQVPVRLPYHAPRALADKGPLTFTIGFDRPADTQAPWSVMLPRYIDGVEVEINGAVLLDAGRGLNSRADRNAFELLPIPDALLKAGPNSLTVRLHMRGVLNGYLDRVFVGPDTALRPASELRGLIFRTLPIVFAAWQAILAILLGVMWLKRRAEPLYGVFAVAMALGVVQALTVAPTAQTPFPTLNAVLLAAPALEAACLVIFMLAFLGVAQPRHIWLVFVPGALVAFIGLVGEPMFVLRAFLTVGVPMVLLSIVFMFGVMSYMAIERGDGSAALLGSATTVLLSFGVHDLLFVQNIITTMPYFVGRLSYSALLVAIGIGLVWRFATALNEVDGFAGRMIALVNEAEEKLRRSLALDEERSRTAALAGERNRLMRDLHDGLGGQLVSIVALSEQPAWEGPRIGEAARAALRDLRLVVDAMDDIDGDLMLALATWRERTLAQLRPHGLELVWRVEGPQGLPVHPELRPWHVIQILRLLDEAVTNAVKHAAASAVTVTIETLAGGANPSVGGEKPADEAARRRGRITVADDGGGFPAPEDACDGVPKGRGLANMRRRAARCGAALHVHSAPGAGTVVRLDLPAVFPDVEQSG